MQPVNKIDSLSALKIFLVEFIKEFAFCYLFTCVVYKTWGLKLQVSGSEVL